MIEEQVPPADVPGFDSDGEIDDDFLYHLYQGGELLRTDRVEEAKEHLEHAFALQPKNPRSQNLLGLVYFKLGIYERSIQIYEELVERFKDDATLRVNLAMAYYKACEFQRAENELRQAIDLEPQHQNAHKYLGLVLVKGDRFDEARKHFEQGNVSNPEQFIPPEHEAEGVDAELERLGSRQKALAEVAELGFHELESKELPFAPAKSVGLAAAGTDAGAGWTTRESSTSLESTPGGAGKEFATRLKDFEVTDGVLLVAVNGHKYCRLSDPVWSEGDLAYSIVKKRFGGEETNHAFERGKRAMLLVEGDGTLCLSTQGEQRLRFYQHRHGSAYFLEDYVYAFDHTDAWENGRLSSGTDMDLSIFHLFGPAELVLLVPGEMAVHHTDGSQRVRVHADRLVGWQGNMVPRLTRAEPPLPESWWIELIGNGGIYVLA